MGHYLSKDPSAFQQGAEHESSRNYILKHFACIITFFGFLLLLSWYYGRSDFERWDPVKAANEERDSAIEQRDDAQRTWQKTESKYEKTLATNLELHSRLAKGTKDIPWLKQRLSELVEENNIQHEAIKDLEAVKRKFDKLSKQVNDYGLSAERPEHHQKRAEEFRRSLEVSNNSLQTSQSYAKGLEERLQTQCEKSKTEIKWLRARLRSNARSTGYWARYRQHADDPEFKPAWGVRCACTEPEIGYSLRDQGPRIIDLEDTVARLLGKALNTSATAFRAKAEEELTAKDTVIKDLRGEKEAATTMISDLNHTLSESRKDLADAHHESADHQRELRQHKAMVEELRNDIAGKDVEISRLESANPENIRLLTIANTNLIELRRVNAEYKEQSETQNAKIGEWEAARRELDARVETKDHKIAELEEKANEQSGAYATKLGEWETARRDFEARVEAKDHKIAELEEKANEQSGAHTTKLGEWEAARREFNARVEAKDDRIVKLEAQIYEQSETHTAKIGEWEAAGREFNARVEAKDAQIAKLEQQIHEQSETYTAKIGEWEAAGRDFDTYKKDKDYYADREQEIQRQWTEHSRSHVNCGGQITTLTKNNRVLQGQLADLRTKFQQAKNQTDPLQEMQLKERDVAVKAKEDALKKSTDPMENDQQVSNSGGLEMEDLERRLAAANQEINNVKNRNRVVLGQLNTEKKERSEEKARHEKLLKKEQDHTDTKCKVLRLDLEKNNPLKRVVSKLQDEVLRLRGEVEKRK